MPKIKYNRNVFDKIDSDEKAYWLGFIIADGYLHHGKNMMRIKLNSIDKNHLIKFINFVGGPLSMLKKEIHNTTGNELYYVSLYSKEVKKALNNLGVKQAKSEKEVVPAVDKKLYKSLIRGIWDGDGFIRKKGDGIGLVGSYEILSFVQNHFKEELNVKPLKIHSHGTIFKIEYRSQSDIVKILTYLYNNSPIYLDRKYNLFQLICRV